MHKRFTAIVCVAMLIICGGVSSNAYSIPKPKAGYVPDAQTAVLVAEAILVPIYGAETIRGERPFRAALQGRVWLVTGTLPAGYVGGVAEIEISKDDGHVLRVSHGK